MVRRCVIEGCDSKSSVPEHKGVTFHSFPFDSKTREIWIENCHIPADKNITKNILVCSRHFRRADFQPIKNGKFLLKGGSIPTVFSWKKADSSSNSTSSGPVSRVNSEAADEVTTSSTVEATIASIMAETDKLNRAAGISTIEATKRKFSQSDIDSPLASPQAAVKIDAPLVFTPGVRLEVQEINGQWHSGKVVEVDNDDREVLIKFEKSGKSKRSESEEWIPMNSPRLRQKASAKPPPLFVTDEKCFARWTGSRKFPATVQKVLGEDLYEVLFEDGFVKTVRGNHMGKLKTPPPKVSTVSPVVVTKPSKSPKSSSKVEKDATPTTSKVSAESTPKTSSKKKMPRKDWPLISMDTLDLASLNLPEVPQDGEWTCHWVNDQPIGREGFLLIGEHKKPTVIVDDWRLPPNWVKHMYQRSNVLGKWDVILVNPAGKRFRSKADLKQALEDAGQIYNPDIYDFSIHRRRAKDINAYVYTPDYKPPPKTTTSTTTPSTPSSSTVDISRSTIIETPVVTPVPPMELMTPTPAQIKSTETIKKEDEIKEESKTPDKVATPALEPVEDGFAYIGGLKVEIIDNLFRCPQSGCSKNFRKENHLQIHVKHYHPDLIKLLGECPNMQDLALKRTIGHPEPEPLPKNQIPNQQFFAKMHQIDIQQSRSHRKSSANVSVSSPAMTSPIHQTTTTSDANPPSSTATEELQTSSLIQENSTLDSSILTSDTTLVTGDKTSILKKDNTNTEVLSTTEPAGEPVSAPEATISEAPILPPAPKKSKISSSKKVSHPGARKSSRQRTTKKYLTSTPSSSIVAHAPTTLSTSFDSSFGGNDFEDIQSTGPPEKTVTAPSAATSTSKKVKQTPVATNEPIAAVDSSLSSSFVDPTETPQYIKENGELIKIVRMKQEEIINCLCNYGEEDGLMIQCELCLCWQHGTCNGIEKESDVPDKYICVICSNPQCGRESRKYVHDQDWMYEGKLPAANYHEENPMHPERFELLKKSHTLAGNLVELKRFLHSLQVKINIAENKDHPKMYLWEKRWDPVPKEIKTENDGIKLEDGDVEMKDVSKIQTTATEKETENKNKNEPIIPQPEAPIDPVECQHRLLEHIKVQQNLVLKRLDCIEAKVDELEALDNLPDLKTADIDETKDVLATFIKELETMKSIARINAMVHKKRQQQMIFT